MLHTPPVNMQPQIVFITDRGFLKPTLVAMWGALRHLSLPGIVHFWGNGLTDEDWKAVERVAKINPKVTLNCLALADSDLAEAKKPTKYITETAMGRLYIPSRLSGRVLYIDGDTQIIGDVAPLFSLDMKGALIGAVRDYFITARHMHNRNPREKVAKRVRELQGILGQNDISKYFNSGVLLMDTDTIRAHTELLEDMQDIIRASSHPLGDQDHLNRIFLNRVHLLNPAYNSSRGRAEVQRRQINRYGGATEETKSMKNIIIHFHGAEKPWKVARYDLWRRRARAVWNYRRELREYGLLYPDLVP